MPISLARLPVGILFAWFLGGIACSDEGPPDGSGTTGTIEVTTSTTGTEPDPDGYTIQVDAEPPEAIGTAATTQIAEVEAGSHTLHLASLAPNCTVTENPVTASVAAGETVTVTFEVTCEATTGGLQLTATTTGPSPDADGYTVTVDGAERGALATSGQLSVDALVTGNHSVGLSGVAANCQVQGDNPRTVAVTGGAAASVAFSVTCTEPPPGAGTLRITTATTGADPDPNGYTIVVDGRAAQPIGVNAAANLTNVAGGAHTVQLGGLAPNCSAQGTNPRSATVTAGATAEVSFAITCTATNGTIRVNVTTTGSQVDEVYTAKLDGTGSGKRVEANTAVSFAPVPAGSHTIVLSGVATNCAVAEGTSQAATVAPGQTVEVGFTVTCTATTGTIEVTVTATGSPPDPDGFTVQLGQNGPTKSIPGSGGSESFSAVTAGDHDVTLTGWAANCSVPDGEDSKSVTVQAGAPAPVAFTVTCSATGEIWSSIPLPPQFTATALWASSSGFLFVAGSYADAVGEVAILHYDGHQWTLEFRSQGTGRASFGGSVTGGDLTAVIGSTAVLQYQLGDWVDVGPQNEAASYASIWPSSGQLFAGGFLSAIPDNGLVSHYDGTAWTLQTPGHGYGSNGLVTDLSGISPTDVYALGHTSPSGQDPEEEFTDYLVQHFDGSTWSPSFGSRVGFGSPDGYSLHGLWANATNDVFVVGSGGHIDHFNGTAWSPMTSPATQLLADIWGNSPSNVYAVGNEGVLHYNGIWRIINPTPASRVWGSAEEVFVLTQDAVLYAEHEAATAAAVSRR